VAFYVQKYGGSSVADPEKIRNVAERIVETYREGNQVLAVVSARGDSTDELIDLAREVSDTHPRREMDLLMATGETQSSALLAMAIEDLGEEAVALTAHQMRIQTDVSHTKARILDIDGKRIRREFDTGKIVVAAGFQGVTDQGDITTLGRGGSDTTAVALASVLDADRCDIFTDVEGVFTADPRMVDEAHRIPRIDYEEMLELASLGTEVLQVRAVEFGWKYNVDIQVRSSFNDDPGTIITEGGTDMEEVDVRAVATDLDQTRISVKDVPDQPGIAAKLFGGLADENINVDMIVQSSGAREEVQNDISFTVSRRDFDGAVRRTRRTSDELNAQGVTTHEDVAQVSVVGTGMRNHPGVAKKVFSALGEHDINIEMISTSEIRISVIIQDDQVEEAVNILHDTFDL
jgi:aspartate kinase